jgi:MFS family permease
MEKDLGLKGNQFQASVSLVFVTYVILEVPSNMVLKKMTPRIWIAIIALVWGVVATLTGVVNKFSELVVCRLLLGAAEAGLLPGIVLYLSLFYTPSELGLRVGYILVSVTLAGCVSGLAAYGIGHMEGIAGLHAWRWIMIIEGIPSVLWSVVVYFLLPNSPETTYFFSDAEKVAMKHKLSVDYGQTESAQKINKADFMKAILDWKVWLISTAHFGILTMVYGKY